MYDETEILKVMQQHGRVAGHARKLREIFTAVADEAWAANAVFSAVPNTSDFELTGFFGVIRAEFGFGRAAIDGVTRYVGQYDFRVMGRNDSATTIFSLVFPGTGELVGVERMPSLGDIEVERYPAAKRLLIGLMLQKWMDALPTLD